MNAPTNCVSNLRDSFAWYNSSIANGFTNYNVTRIFIVNMATITTTVPNQDILNNPIDNERMSL